MLFDRHVNLRLTARIALRLSALFCLIALLWPAPAGAADSLRLYFEPATVAVDPGSTFTVNVSLAGTHPVYGVDVTVAYDPALLEVVDADAAKDGVQLQPGALFLGKQTLAVVNKADNAAGLAQYAVSMFGEKEGVIQGGTVLVLQFRAKAAGQATLTLTEKTMVVDPAQLVVPLTLEPAQVTVRGAASPGNTAPASTVPAATVAPTATTAPAQPTVAATAAQPVATVDAAATIAAQITPAVTLAPATATAVAQAVATAAATAAKGQITPTATSQPTATATPAPGGLAKGRSGSTVVAIVAFVVIVGAVAAWLVARGRRRRT